MTAMKEATKEATQEVQFWGGAAAASGCREQEGCRGEDTVIM